MLRLMRDGDLYRSLGFVRLSDYVVERLGLSYRSAQEMMRVDAALEALPLTASAVRAGEVTSGHVRLLARVAAPETEAFWVGLARRMGVKALARVVASHACPRADEAVTTSGVGGGGAHAAGASEKEPDRQRLEIVAPAWMAGMWRDSVTLVRGLVGSNLPPGICLEMVLAEVAEAIPRDDAESARQPDEPTSQADSRRRPSSETTSPLTDGPDDTAANLPARCELQTSAPSGAGGPAGQTSAHGPDSPNGPTETSSDGDVGAPLRRASAPAGSAAPGQGAADLPAHETGLDPRAVDRELRSLVTERQRQDALLAEHLHLVARTRGYRDEGYSSLEEYAADRLGLSAGTLYHLLALHRRLEALPGLRREFLAGRLTARQAILVGSVAAPPTLEGWLLRAGSVTLRRLEDEVSYWRHLRESRPAVWACLEGGPLPEGVALVPGQPPRLQSSAPSSGESSAPIADGAAALSAEAFLGALVADEGATPLPERMCVIRLLVEPDVTKMWEATVSHLRSTVRADLREWEALALVLREFWSVWDNEETRRQRRENPILERDGWRCSAPGCRSVGTGKLHVHHVIPRSAGGGDEPWNTCCLCGAHHIGLLHEGKVNCSGSAPDGLLWEMGVEQVRGPFLVFAGETLIGGEGA